MKIVKQVALIFVTFIGIISLLATGEFGPPGHRSIRVITRNPTNELYNISDSYACKNDKIRIDWDLSQTGNITITTQPINNLEPSINNLEISGIDSKEVIFKAEVALILGFKEKVTQKIIVLPKSICHDYPIIPVGKYEGELKQNSPETASFNRYFDLFWDPQEHSLRAQMQDKNQDNWSNRVLFSCISKPDQNLIICRQQYNDDNEKRNLEMLIKVTKDGLRGSYRGETKSAYIGWLKFSGEFQFSKR